MSVLVEAQRVAIARAIAANPDIGVEAGWGTPQSARRASINLYHDIVISWVKLFQG